MLVFFLLLWIVLNGRITPEILIIGCLIAGAGLLFARRATGYTLQTDIRICRNIPIFLIYILRLIWEVLKASVMVMTVVFNPFEKPEPVIVEFHSGLETELQNVLLANSITLTPGTYTLFQEGDHFVSHCLRREYADGMGDSAFIRYLKMLR